MAFFRWWRRPDDLNAEIRSHLDLATEDHVARGTSRRDAVAKARRDLGNMGQIQEATRDVWGWRWLEHLIQDAALRDPCLYSAIPGLRSSPSCPWRWASGRTPRSSRLWTRVRLRSLPVADPARLVDIHIVDMAGARGSFETWQPAVTYPDLAGDRGATAGVLGRLRVGHGSVQPGDRRRDSSGDGSLGRAASSSTSSGCSLASDACWVRRRPSWVPGARFS